MAKKRKEARYKKLIGIACIIVSVGMIYTLVVTAVRVLERREELAILTEQRDALQEEKDALEEEVDLLNDDDYAARYARDNYIFPSEGEEVVILPEQEE
ncbi:MAG: septum formation initiator family protein [Erysipelotrichaceae bacterium]|nr:septum formation initiator family protein [Erysipelotrichaceae bacterium]